jgi:hypothetical protein
MAHIALIVLVVIGARLVYVHTHEFRTCRWCKDKRKRRRGCWRCKGAGITRRWGAWHTHKLAQALREAWAERRSR